MKWRCLDRTFDLWVRGEIVGILNVTPDSFSDGGRYESVDRAAARALELFDEGAAIVDVGGESTRPGAEAVDAAQERERVVPVIEAVRRRRSDACLSIDTSKPAVARAALEAGAAIVNDVTGFRDPEMVDLAAATGAGLVVMHMQGTPRTMQERPAYGDVVEEVRAFFEDRHEALLRAGVEEESVVYDPGIGFGKTLEHNLELLRRPERLVVAGRPLLFGLSRKSFIGTVLGSDRMEDRGWPTVALTARARERGVPLHRVHEVGPNLEALRMAEAIAAGG